MNYQVSDLIKTITLTPKETRKVTTKRVVKNERNVKEDGIWAGRHHQLAGYQEMASREAVIKAAEEFKDEQNYTWS